MLEILNTFKSHPFIAKLSDRERMVLAAGAQPFHFRAGDFLAVEGRTADDFFLIQSGEAAIESDQDLEDEVRIQHLGPGDVLGWSWLVEPHRWEFSCRALGEVEGIKFNGSWLRQLCNSDLELGNHLLKQLLRAVASRLTSMRMAYRTLLEAKAHSGRETSQEPVLVH